MPERNASWRTALRTFLTHHIGETLRAGDAVIVGEISGMGAVLERQGGGATIFAAREGVQGGHMPQVAHSVSLAAFRLGPTRARAPRRVCGQRRQPGSGRPVIAQRREHRLGKGEVES